MKTFGFCDICERLQAGVVVRLERCPVRRPELGRELQAEVLMIVLSESIIVVDANLATLCNMHKVVDG